MAVVSVGAVAFGLGVGGPAAGAGSAGAGSTGVVVAVPGSARVGRYALPLVVLAPGDAPEVVNADINWHDVVSSETGPDDRPWCAPLDPAKPEGPANPRRYPLGSCPLFWSVGALPLGGTSRVYGLDAPEPGRVYAFHCTFVAGMTGGFVAPPA